MDYAVPIWDIPTLDIEGTSERFPIHRIYCVGRNYGAHAKEMGFDANREAPFFFTKPADAVVPNGATIPYPKSTENLHHEAELVVAIGSEASDVPVEKALDHVFGYAIGNDLTRRDLQMVAREKGRPWDTGKAFDRAAPMTTLKRVADVGHIDKGAIWLTVNGETRQSGDVSELIWSVPEVISILSGLFDLKPGDLIMTGTPAGVGAVKPGDVMVAGIDGLGELTTTIAR